MVDGTGPTITAVSQQIAPADYQADGVFWHNLGVFQVTSGTTLVVQLNGNSSPVLADAVQLVACDAAPAGNMSLSAGAFSINAQGQMSVTYTVNSSNGSSVVPFSIGICGSPDKTQPTNVLQEYQVADPSMLTPGQHTALIDAALSGLTEDDYLVAKLDVNNQIYQTSQSSCVSLPATLPPGGMFQQSDGSLYVLGVPDSGNNNIDDSVGVAQDPNSGNVTITTTNSSGSVVSTNTFSGVSDVTVSTPLGGNSIAVDPTMPVSVFGGAASSANGNTGTGVSGQTANLPTISVAADSNAQPAVFYVKSDGTDTSDLVVQCVLTPNGTARLTTDFRLSGNGLTTPVWNSGSGTYTFSVTIPAGQDAATITVSPVSTSSLASVTASLTLQPNAAYTVSSSSSAAATITTQEQMTIGFANSSATVNITSYTGPSVSMNINRTGQGNWIAFDYSIAGTATNGSDYVDYWTQGPLGTSASDLSDDLTITPYSNGGIMVPPRRSRSPCNLVSAMWWTRTTRPKP